MRMHRPRFTLRRLMAAVAIVALFLWWVRFNEMRRAEFYRALSLRFARDAEHVTRPRLATELTRHGEQAMTMAVPWSGTWIDTLLFSLLGVTVVGLLALAVGLLARGRGWPGRYLRRPGHPQSNDRPSPTGRPRWESGSSRRSIDNDLIRRWSYSPSPAEDGP